MSRAVGFFLFPSPQDDRGTALGVSSKTNPAAKTTNPGSFSQTIRSNKSPLHNPLVQLGTKPD
ncbi:MAG: hypothetical protein A2600_05825 [Candidatus Lambdaproteobacteria bacterium RIFOXYD1_FULL_56_27]|uniref:Uncharacterized protein n=1 Tax=Candidatus Lambdaproteobacteria bacterium RIFOXYD2_FULL_56_26 TaxID=1817773 RepID=A0A1F6GRA5_9PROT|nr:MAG: hypothetical protein A2426_11030 [Candidatus Lambdaproteobacteria bacterium RIFOXYC1_FULL_56_13]OGH00716.1 MAG: hypothetical protein A2557_03530 [Candidatus Lambdaproteobacteria bacterium RIFOXYD2_FULL_56_26]OGH07883.1 MAG: hypothetical protein A2600_05825 [Candidatus Lambdaproteobacteria bacterium RIFOXYD1_FULL_56_27]